MTFGYAEMIILAALILGGAVVYLANPDGGAVLIALGVAGAVVTWLARATRRWVES